MEEGMEIPVFYDPMISKLVVYGANREEAMDRMKRAISEYQITGVATTLPFGTYVMNHPAFRSGQFDTNFIKLHFRPEEVLPKGNNEELAAILSALELEKQKQVAPKTPNTSPGLSAWKMNR
jgi:acetyl/propionyl-CoA carboxylase alpha subunit